MSICLSGQNTVSPKHNKRINSNTDSHGDNIIGISGVFPERIKKDTIQSKRKKRTKEEISSKHNFVKSFKQTSMKRRQDLPRFFDVSTHKDNKKVDDRKCVDDVIHGVHCSDTKCATIDVCCRDEKFSLIQLEDQDYIHAHKKHRPKDDGKDEDRQDFEKVCFIRHIRNPKEIIKNGCSNVIPIGISICVNGSINSHDDHK